MRRLSISFFLLSLFALSSSNIIPLRAHRNFNAELGQIFDNTSNQRDNIDATNPCKSDANEFPDLCKILNRREVPDGTAIGLTADANKGYGMDERHDYLRQLDYSPSYGEDQNALADRITRFLLSFGDQDNDKSELFEDAVLNNGLNNKMNAINERPYGIQLKPETRRPNIISEPEKGEQEYLTSNDIGDNNLNSAIYMLEIKKKAANKPESEYFDENENPAISRKSDLKTVVKKRYISLWSRLQAMSPNRAHELPHRRHLHLFYHHLPEDIEGRPIPEDPRALFKRPPGSPLRWG